MSELCVCLIRVEVGRRMLAPLKLELQVVMNCGWWGFNLGPREAITAEPSFQPVLGTLDASVSSWLVVCCLLTPMDLHGFWLTRSHPCESLGVRCVGCSSASGVNLAKVWKGSLLRSCCFPQPFGLSGSYFHSAEWWLCLESQLLSSPSKLYWACASCGSL